MAQYRKSESLASGEPEKRKMSAPWRRVARYRRSIDSEGGETKCGTEGRLYARANTHRKWKRNRNRIYADKANAYWTGYFSSRPALKRYVRMMSGYYLAARQLEFFKGRSNSGPNTDVLADALAIAQHHDAVSGTEQQHVANDYTKRLSMGYVEAKELVASSLGFLAKSTSDKDYKKPVTKFEQVVVIYNSLGWKREDVVRIPVIGELVTVRDSTGSEIESQLVHISNNSLGIRDYYVNAYLGKSPDEIPKYWLAFFASVPPLGFSTYTVSIAKGGASSVISRLHTTEGTKTGTIQIGQGDVKLIYAVDEGKLTHYINSRSSVI
ncbi:hypothetical protein IFM89_030706 [Coptis chinensis]|uniref:Glycoside hydrolase family 38 central domain-containing protein n=1 Tax=Coptis chinensis TaxID=261450 RepID=A0A835J2R8_9MAGN|nr:hypothetical protein IFM89_030706 [Coptis chinensis]